MKFVTFLILIWTIQIANSGISPGCADVKNEDGILVFASFDHLENTIKELEANQAEIDAKIAANCDQSSSTDVIQTEDELDECTSKFADQDGAAFAQFENSLGFKSLRSINDELSKNYFKSEASEVDRAREPGSELYRPQDQTVLNSRRQVKIGDQYHQLTDSEHLIFASREALDKAQTTSHDAIQVLSGSSRRLQFAWCRTNVFNSGYYYCANNRRIRWVNGHYWWFFSYRAYAFTSCQRKFFFNWWWYTALSVNLARAWGAVSNPIIIGCSVENNTCRSQFIFNTLSSSNYNQGWGFFTTHTVCVATKTASGWVKGQHRSRCCPDVNYLSTLYF